MISFLCASNEFSVKYRWTLTLVARGLCWPSGTRARVRVIQWLNTPGRSWVKMLENLDG